MKIFIKVFGEHQTLRFAAEELARYLSLANVEEFSIKYEGQVTEGANVFFLGLYSDLGVDPSSNVDSETDWFCIRPYKQGYMLCGSNPRSVLFAVYRYLREMGFRWIRPGERGEIIPILESPLGKDIRIEESASYRYRTICIEGACSYEHVRDLIDWAAKHGMNGYFLQLHLGSVFWRKWYQDTGNPYREGRRLRDDEIEAIVNRVIGEIKKRNLRFERVGHGWTCMVLGIPGEGWVPYNSKDIPIEKSEWIALVGGRREFHRGVPLNTNLCYSSSDVRRAIVGSVVSYAAKHPEVDALHFWLADGSNNNCECEKCRETRPSDFYVEMLNEIDEGLTLAHLDTKIVFLIYVDLLWPPQKNTFKNEERFILMFAPITRSYKRSFAEIKIEKKGIAEYVRNNLIFPHNVGENIRWLQEWQKTFNGDGFDFDYHLIWPLYFDLSQFSLAHVLHRDIKSLGDIGLDGFNSCQNQRASFPHNLLLDVLSRTLWNKTEPFDQIVEDTFSDAYREDWRLVVDHFKEISLLWEPIFEPLFSPEIDEERVSRATKNINEIKKSLTKFELVVTRNLAKSYGAVLWSWKYLEKYLELMEPLLSALESYIRCSKDCRDKFEKVFEYLWQNEVELHPTLDIMMYIRVLGRRVSEVETTLKRIKS